MNQESQTVIERITPNVHLSQERLLAVAEARSFVGLTAEERVHLERCRPCLYLLERIATYLRTHGCAGR